jgi:hypothetical protein
MNGSRDVRTIQQIAWLKRKLVSLHFLAFSPPRSVSNSWKKQPKKFYLNIRAQLLPDGNVEVGAMNRNDVASVAQRGTAVLDSAAKNGPETFAVDSGSQLEAIPGSSSLNVLTEICPSPRGVELKTLKPYDTIIVRTANSLYRIFLLDPETGRVLLEGGRHISEPVEATIIGSSFGGTVVRTGWIGVGLRVDAWAGDKYIRTSLVKSLRLEHKAIDEQLNTIH